MKLYIRIHTFTIRPGSSTGTGGSTLQSKPQRPGFLDPVAGTSVNYAHHLPNLLFNRICPGRHFALRMLQFTIARILATFDILPPVGDDRRPQIPEARYHKSIIRSVYSFRGETGLISDPVLEIRCHSRAWYSLGQRRPSS